jgi:Ca2+-binding EF-hand superfamily protein
MGCADLNASQASNVVDPIEVHWELRKYFINIPQRASLMIAKLLDRNGDMVIDKREFAKFLDIMEHVKEENDVYKVIFRAGDKDESGKIDQKELALIFKALSISDDPAQYGASLDEEAFKNIVQPHLEKFLGNEDVPFDSLRQPKLRV